MMLAEQLRDALLNSAEPRNNDIQPGMSASQQGRG